MRNDTNDKNFDTMMETVARAQQQERLKGWLALFGVAVGVLALFTGFIQLAPA